MGKILWVIVFFAVIIGGYLFFFTKPTVAPDTEQNGADIAASYIPATAEGMIVVSSPAPGDTITSPLAIQGKARGYWFFEASFPVRLLDDNGQVLAQGIAETPLNWMTEDFVEFRANLSFSQPSTEKGMLVLEKDNPSDMPENDGAVLIPVIFGKTAGEKTAVRVHFSTMPEGSTECNTTVAVERVVPKTQAVARAALEELLKGPTQEEKSQDLFTSINPGVKIQSLTIEDGIAKVDFDQQLQYQVGGSCRVAAIRAEITNTLKEFPTIQEVIISINGETEEVLQP
ncbi:MAG: GerMN domain-containing protein [Candidatus Colwellbacteria bacterium]|nr:GerMN domain-containing protein [Candidatus Colwellbacteria bacterium]